jgi:ankyrin repeat protein
MAIKLGRIHIRNTLVGSSASTNISDNLGSMALHVAVSKGDLTFVHCLIDPGDGVNLPDIEGRMENYKAQWNVVQDHLTACR